MQHPHGSVRSRAPCQSVPNRLEGLIHRLTRRRTRRVSAQTERDLVRGFEQRPRLIRFLSRQVSFRSLEQTKGILIHSVGPQVVQTV